MKKILIFLLFFVACEKTENIELEQCWICTETVKTSGTIINITKTEVCDILEVTKLDGKRIIKISQNGKVTSYITVCEEKR